MVVEGAPSLSPWLLLLRVSTVELYSFIFTHIRYVFFRLGAIHKRCWPIFPILSEDGHVAKFHQLGLEMMVVEGAPSLSPWLLLLRVSTVELYGFISSFI